MRFSKYEGAGNDFILIDNRSLSFDPSTVSRLCHRKWGIGADGLILLQNDPAADLRMRIFNSDGSEAESCGNGLRCFVRFAADLGLSSDRIALHDRIVHAFLTPDQVGVCLGEPRHLRLNIPLPLKDSLYTLHLLDTGVPHAVLFVDDLNIDVHTLGSKIRRHPVFGPKGVNVNFALRQNNAYSIRTFERGVEAETLACGTGAAAVAVIGAHLFSTPSPISIHVPGGHLQITFATPAFSDLSLIGPARCVFSGSYS